ncbi:hypothetical protein [Brevundimonas nasdae]|uniref:hypothetical protein n=1 Tax=Brevundimonas nasdae TaxID=172043 RepID=UPI003F68C3AF
MSKLDKATIDAICEKARHTWGQAPPREREVTFTWDGERYFSELTTIRTTIKDTQGRLVTSYTR